MKKKLYLYWFRINDGSSNYGDELNNYIISEITDLKVHHTPYPYKWYKIPFIYLNNLIRKKGIRDFRGMLNSLFAKEILFGIGSILENYDRKGIIVWGSGIIRKKANVKPAHFLAVRGLETLKLIKNLGYIKTDIPLGDPALLLPLIYQPSIVKNNKIGIIPNYKQFNELKEKQINENFILIDLKNNINSVTNQICSCKYIISTSLHGIIVAHAYKIPALWVDLNLSTRLVGDDTKFYDYFTSVKIDPYKPLDIKNISEDVITGYFNKYQDRALLNINLQIVQKHLLKSFPYKLKRKYNELI